LRLSQPQVSKILESILQKRGIKQDFDRLF